MIMITISNYSFTLTNTFLIMKFEIVMISQLKFIPRVVLSHFESFEIPIISLVATHEHTSW